MTAAYLLPLSIRAFLISDENRTVFTEKDRDPGMRMLIPFAVLSLTMLLLGIHASPVMLLLEQLVTGG